MKNIFKVYTIQANVFATKLGSQFGRTVSITINTDNLNKALMFGKQSMQKYCESLEKHHNNKFDFDNIKIV